MAAVAGGAGFLASLAGSWRCCEGKAMRNPRGLKSPHYSPVGWAFMPTRIKPTTNRAVP